MCSGCALQTITGLTPPLCEVCSQSVEGTGRCSNRLCRETDRSIDKIRAIAAYSQPLKQSIIRLKGTGTGWRIIFGRLVLGYLNVEYWTGDLRPDLIVPNPTYRDDGRLGHTELVLEAAEREDIYDNWDFRAVGLRKTGPSPAHGTSYDEKRKAADTLLGLLEVEDGLNVKGLDVLVYDDVCTTGLQLDRVARYLKDRGATRVEGLVMARTQWA